MAKKKKKKILSKVWQGCRVCPNCGMVFRNLVPYKVCPACGTELPQRWEQGVVVR